MATKNTCLFPNSSAAGIRWLFVTDVIFPTKHQPYFHLSPHPPQNDQATWLDPCPTCPIWSKSHHKDCFRSEAGQRQPQETNCPTNITWTAKMDPCKALFIYHSGVRGPICKRTVAQHPKLVCSAFVQLFHMSPSDYSTCLFDRRALSSKSAPPSCLSGQSCLKLLPCTLL